MQDPISRLCSLSRPRVLIDAARLARLSYQRSRDLPRALGHSPGRAPGHGAAMMALFETEQILDEARRFHDASYRADRHIATLAALLAEADMIKAGTA